MPSRIVREGINSSQRINELTFMAELFYRRLMSVADDHGRYFAELSVLHAACFPVKTKRVTDVEIASWLDECCAGDKPLIRTYEVSGEPYLQIVDFGQQIRSKSKFPDCLSIDKQMLSGCEANAQPSRSRISYSEASAQKPRAPIPIRKVPEDAEPRIRAIAESAPDQQDFERGVEMAIQQLLSAGNPEAELTAMEQNIPLWWIEMTEGRARPKCLRFVIQDRDYLRPPKRKQKPTTRPEVWKDPYAHLVKTPNKTG